MKSHTPTVLDKCKLTVPRVSILVSQSSRLETQFSILENFEHRVSSQVSRILRIENRVSSRETNELVT